MIPRGPLTPEKRSLSSQVRLDVATGGAELQAGGCLPGAGRTLLRDGASLTLDPALSAGLVLATLQAERDYGPEDAFLALEGQCFSTVAEKYTYEVCPHGAAAQKEGGSHTRCARSGAR